MVRFSCLENLPCQVEYFAHLACCVEALALPFPKPDHLHHILALAAAMRRHWRAEALGVGYFSRDIGFFCSPRDPPFMPRGPIHIRRLLAAWTLHSLWCVGGMRRNHQATGGVDNKFKSPLVCWEYPTSYGPVGDRVMECSRAQYVLYSMWMAHPGQAGSLQGPHGVSCGALAVNDPGIGSGWQQSKQNWALPAVVGQWARMQCSDLC
jgi:hypothetical protein